ncbi:MAG: hypothetical protein ACYC2X_11555 [Coriobacteriia bacterium]
MSDWTFGGVLSVLFGLFFWVNAPAYADFQMKRKRESASDRRAHVRWARIVGVAFAVWGALMILGLIGR